MEKIFGLYPPSDGADICATYRPQLTSNNRLTDHGSAFHPRIEGISPCMPPSPVYGRGKQPQCGHSGREPKVVLAVIEGKAGLYRNLKGSLEFRMGRCAVVAFARILHD